MSNPTPTPPGVPRTLTYPDNKAWKKYARSQNSTFRARSYNPLLFAAGAEPSWILNRSERSRLVSQGALVWLIALIGGSAMVLFCSTILDGYRHWFIGVGVVWGLIVFFIDRWITGYIDFGPMESGELEQGKKSKVGMFVTRLVLAVVIGIFIAEPIIMAVFDDRIQVKLDEIHSEQVAGLNGSVPKQFAARSAAIQNALGTSSSALVTATAQEAAAKKAFDEEASGTGGTRVPGEGPDTQRQRDAYAAAQQRTRDAANALAVAQETHTRESAELQQMIDAEIAVQTSRINNSRDLLDREEALRKVISEHGWLAFVRWYLTAVLVLIDLMPLLLKYASGKTLYVRAARNDAVASVYGTNTQLRKQTAVDNAPLDLELLQAKDVHAHQQWLNDQAVLNRDADARAAEFDRKAAVATAEQDAFLQERATRATAADVAQGINDRQGVDVSALVAAHLQDAGANLADRLAQRRRREANPKPKVMSRDQLVQPPARVPQPAADPDWNFHPAADRNDHQESVSDRSESETGPVASSDSEGHERVYQIRRGTSIRNAKGDEKWLIGKRIPTEKGISTLFHATEIPGADGRKTWNHDFVVKVYHHVGDGGPDDDENEEHRYRMERAKREAADYYKDRTANDIGSDSHIAQVFYAGQVGTDFVIVRKAYEETLDKYLPRLAADGKLTMEKTWMLAEQLLTGLRTAWEGKDVHLDIKPANVGVDKDEFGQDLLQIFDWEGRKHSDGTNAFATQGGDAWSYFYSPPEQITRMADWGRFMEHADLRAWAAVWYEMVTGSPPHQIESREAGLFTADDPKPALKAYLDVVDRDPRKLSDFPGADIPSVLDDAIARWLSNEPLVRNKFNSNNIQGFLGDIDRNMDEIREALMDDGGRYADTSVGQLVWDSIVLETEGNAFRDDARYSDPNFELPPQRQHGPSDRDDDGAEAVGPRPPADLPRPPSPNGGRQSGAFSEIPTQKAPRHLTQGRTERPAPGNSSDDLGSEGNR